MAGDKYGKSRRGLLWAKNISRKKWYLRKNQIGISDYERNGEGHLATCRLCACGMKKRCVWEEAVVYEQHEKFVLKHGIELIRAHCYKHHELTLCVITYNLCNN